MTLKNIDLHSGLITYDEFYIDPNMPYEKQIQNLDQDLLQIEYKLDLIINISWLLDNNPNGRFIIRVFKSEDVICRKETRNFQTLEKYLQESIDLVEDIISGKEEINTLTQKRIINTYVNFDFDRNSFQKKFDEEQINDIESGSYYYSAQLANEFQIAINILAVENFVALTLWHNLTQIFSIGFEGITKISLNEINDQCFLDLYKDDTAMPYWSFLIKPRVCLDVLIK